MGLHLKCACLFIQISIKLFKALLSLPFSYKFFSCAACVMGELCLRLILLVTKWLVNDQHRIRLIVCPEDSIYERGSLLSLHSSKNIYKALKKNRYCHKKPIT